ncbi:UDP-glycosyltransferase UGT5-like isoform X2 [Diabrotica undecimpunctata]|uniref:UDP-glycosyltransferase UGT5-like isoform X2 n=1 Tax=Diabrotica undecimpunctata TaxID=50387 RepID=UPI003B6359D9
MFNINIFFLLCSLSSAFSYNILGIFPVHIKSHMIVFSALMDELVNRGHNVTIIGTFPEKKSHPNLTNIDISRFIPDLVEAIPMDSLATNSRLTKYLEPKLIFDLTDAACLGLSSKSLHHFLFSNPVVDVIIIEDFNTHCYFSIIHKLTAPVIAITTALPAPWTNIKYGIPNNPALVPNPFLSFTDKMNFLQRVENTVITFMHFLLFKLTRNLKDKDVAEKYMGVKPAQLEMLSVNSSLFFTNSHFSLSYAKTLPPNVIEVGGLHIKNPNALPEDLKKWIEDSPEGVIYFCMGSMTKGHTFPRRQREAFLQAFDLLPYRVLWKFENESMEGKSDKILLRKWLPQLDVLCHPNVKLFISHGGMLGTMEAVYCGVPILVMPQFGDQFSNAVALEANGGGVVLRTSDVTEETAYRAIRQAIKMKDQAIALSERFKDRPLPPLETAVYWTEYVVKHKGAPFMKTAAVDMPFYQYYLLDVLAFIFAILGLIMYLAFYITRLILKMILRASAKKVKMQ